jgi:hypothetical protein
MIAGTPVLGVELESYEPHAMHAATQNWPQTNCAVDLWVELLSSMGCDPTPAGACALSADMRGDQWLFLKFPIEDVERLYGVTIDELTVWRPVLDHVVDHAAAGRLLTVEVDGWYLPDTVGVSYHLGHSKTTIVANVVDLENRRLEYFHNAGYYELSGEDFDGVFRVGQPINGEILPPYVEVVGLDSATGGRDVHAIALDLAREHLARRQPGNPIERFAERVRADLPWLSTQDLAMFHVYAFAMVRQCGSTAQVAADFTRWLAHRGESGLAAAAEAFAGVAEGAKTLQFQLARAARGRTVSLDATLADMAQGWQRAMDAVDAALPGAG